MASLAVRNNNPGNLKDPNSGMFQTFATPAEGRAALERDLTGKVTGNTRTGLTPKSNLYDFASVYAPASDKNNPKQYAEHIAAQLGVNPKIALQELEPRIPEFASAVAHNEDSSAPAAGSGGAPGGQLSHSQIIANINAMEQQGAKPGEIQSYLDSLKGQSTGQNSMSAPPPAAGLPVTPLDTSIVNAPPLPPPSASGGLDLIKKGVNFLFPIAGDIYHDIKGDSKKTALQQVGDAGLSALPFIPGLGEAGEAARGAGLVGKLAGSAVAKGAVAGYGAGVSSNLSQGKDIPTSLMPGVETIGGAVLGGAAPAAFKYAGKLAKSVAGIDPQVETELTRMGVTKDPADLALSEHYINATKQHAVDLRAPAGSAQNIAADQLDKAAATIQAKTDAAGAEVGAAKEIGTNVPMPDVSHVADDFRARVAKDYGLVFGTQMDGSVTSHLAPGREQQLSAVEVHRLADTYRQLNSLKGGSVRRASDVISSINNSIHYAKSTQQLGHAFDPIEGLLYHAQKGINEEVRKAVPQLAAANDKLSALKSLETEIAHMAGGDTQRGELLMRRIFSGDKSKDVQDLFGKIYKETGVDLVKHAVLAKHAIDSVGSKADKTLLEQAIEGGVAAHAGGLVSGALKIGGSIARRTIANPEKIGRRLIQGKGTGLVPGIISKAAIETGRAAKAVAGQ